MEFIILKKILFSCLVFFIYLNNSYYHTTNKIILLKKEININFNKFIEFIEKKYYNFISLFHTNNKEITECFINIINKKILEKFKYSTCFDTDYRLLKNQSLAPTSQFFNHKDIYDPRLRLFLQIHDDKYFYCEDNILKDLSLEFRMLSNILDKYTYDIILEYIKEYITHLYYNIVFYNKDEDYCNCDKIHLLNTISNLFKDEIDADQSHHECELKYLGNTHNIIINSTKYNVIKNVNQNVVYVLFLFIIS